MTSPRWVFLNECLFYLMKGILCFCYWGPFYYAVSCFPMDSFWLQLKDFGSHQSLFLPRSFKGGILFEHFIFTVSPIPYVAAFFRLNHITLYNLQPIGALTADRLKKFQERYSSFNDPVIPKFHYGSHYSSAGIVRFPYQLFIYLLS